jgi:STE24 endopeptidase
MFAIGFPLLWALLSLVKWTGPSWWIWGFGLLFGFQLLMLVLYPKLILPLFNKLTPLPEGPLRGRLLALGDRTGFRASTIEVIDGSKRSGHSNAYFTGFGRFRRIVLFDTLIAQLTAEELEAVLAHEIGHYRRGHIPKMIAMSAAMMFGGFGAIAWLAQSSWFNRSFGFPEGELAPSFLLFGLLSGLVTFWFSPLMNALSRRHEYEADAFASQAVGGPVAMVRRAPVCCCTRIPTDSHTSSSSTAHTPIAPRCNTHGGTCAPTRTQMGWSRTAPTPSRASWHRSWETGR